MDIVLLSDANEPKQWVYSTNFEPLPQDQTFWPEVWLKNDVTKVQNIYQIYYSGIDWVDNCAPLLRIAWHILHQLETYLSNKAERGFIILAPSIGGLIVKQMCLCALEVPQFWKFYQRLSGIIFYGCPHTIDSSNELADFLLEEVVNLQLEKSTVKLIQPKFISLNSSFEEIIKENEVYKSIKILSFGIQKKKINPHHSHNNSALKNINSGNFFKPSYGKFVLLPDRRFCSITVPKSPEDFIYWKAVIFIRNILRTHPLYLKKFDRKSSKHESSSRKKKKKPKN